MPKLRKTVTDQGRRRLMSDFAGLPRNFGISPDRMTPDQAAEYLWRRFMAQLER